jgi:hypothetical protein
MERLEGFLLLAKEKKKCSALTSEGMSAEIITTDYQVPLQTLLSFSPSRYYFTSVAFPSLPFLFFLALNRMKKPPSNSLLSPSFFARL